MTTRQQPWNEYEAVLLLEGFLAIEKNEENRANVVKRLSYDLRKMALCRGTEIDEFYRNENGISFQLRSMESAYCGTVAPNHLGFPGRILCEFIA